MYMDKTLAPGYNLYLRDTDANVGMEVAVLVLDAGQRYSFNEPAREVAALLLEGACEFRWADQTANANRPDSFAHDPWCLHVPKGVSFEIVAESHCELYIQMTDNPADFSVTLYRPEDTMIQHAGANGELMGCMRREIKTLFDYESAPYSNMVLGEVLNFPGKWSSYPPHHHPQPEVYLHRFDYPDGFGASFADSEVYKSKHNGLTIIREGFHSQTAAPGYAMMYIWGIRHLPGNPWEKTRIDDPEHAWLWKPDANEHIFTLD